MSAGWVRLIVRPTFTCQGHHNDFQATERGKDHAPPELQEVFVWSGLASPESGKPSVQSTAGHHWLASRPSREEW